MIKLLKKYRRWKDFFKLDEPEVKISIFLTIIVICTISYFEVYQNFHDYEEIVTNIVLELIASMIGLIGISLSGVAIITGLFSQKNVEIIEKRNGEGTFEKIMSSFLLLSISCAIYAFVLMIILIALYSNKPIANEYVFFVIFAVITYLGMFNIFYTVSLVGNCIRIFSIRNKYDKIREKDFFNVANEIRIDYILTSIKEKYKIDQEEFLKDLEVITKASKVANEEEIINYFYQYYSGEKKK